MQLRDGPLLPSFEMMLRGLLQHEILLLKASQ